VIEKKRPNKLRLAIVASGASVFAFSVWMLFEIASVPRSSAPFMFDSLASVPANHVGLVLGCSPALRDGRPSPFFLGRVRAASQLFQAGKVDYLLVSGDNGSVRYDEPTQFKLALIAAGVPSDKIILDYAGFRTLDSVVRARDVFGQSKFTVISQRFHNERAVFLSAHHGIKAIGFSAPDAVGFHGTFAHAREWIARARAVLDLRVFHAHPRFQGPRQPIP
jgi:SanA protein